MPKKLTIGFVKSEFEKKGWEIISKEYIGVDSNLNYICSEGHMGSMTWHSWQRGHGCLTCSGRKKHTIEFVRSEFEKEGWVCISTEYVNSSSKLEYICSKGHRGSIRWGDWQQGHRCQTCVGLKKHTIGFIRERFEKEGWALVSERYMGADRKLKYICSKGHHGLITWHHWNSGKRCPVCHYIRLVGSGNPNWKGGISCEPYCQDWTKEYKEYIKERDNYKYLNPYCNSKNPNDLTIHHINYNKKLCGPENLITICRGCNTRANYDRVWHKLWYKAILNKRYGYIYEEKER